MKKRKGKVLKVLTMAAVVALSGVGMSACGSNNNQTPEIVEETYEIFYYMNGGLGGAGNPMNYTKSETEITLNTYLVRAGYEFAGWYDNAAFNGDPITTLNFNRTGDIYLYAKWTVIHYTITYDAQGGTVDPAATTTYVIGDQVKLPTPERANYTFDGWYENADFTGKPVTDFDSNCVKDVTLYAKWTEAFYKIEYNTLCSEVNQTSRFYKAGEEIKLPTPERANYTFDGWYENADFTGDPVTDFDSSCAKNITLYAKWTYDISKFDFDSLGETFEYTKNESEIKITGIQDNEITEIIIPEGVTSIREYAFVNCSKLTRVIIPNSVTTIGEGAFSDNSLLQNITLPFVGESVNASGDSALFKYVFYQNIPTTLTTVTITGSSKIPDNAFSGCTNLTSITIPNSVTNIGGGAFNNCSNLTGIEIPDSVTSIGDFAFSGCSNLTDIEIPDSVTSIGRYAFNNCSSLTSITIPDSVTSIEENTFRTCSSLTSVSIGNGVTSIGESAFSGCENLTNITIGNGVTSIGNYAFNDCHNSLTSVYYFGTKNEFDAIEGKYAISDYSSKVLYYSKTKPTNTQYKYWHYDNNGNIVKW